MNEEKYEMVYPKDSEHSSASSVVPRRHRRLVFLIIFLLMSMTVAGVLFYFQLTGTSVGDGAVPPVIPQTIVQPHVPTIEERLAELGGGGATATATDPAVIEARRAELGAGKKDAQSMTLEEKNVMFEKRLKELGQ